MLDENCPKFLSPRLRVFLSADIVGSTALKQADVGKSDPTKSLWFSVIQGFYIESRQKFLSEWERAKRDAGQEKEELFGEPPQLWKTIGDEVLFVKVLSDYRQLSVILNCWIKAVSEMRGFVKNYNSSLDIKCTAWLAGFPIKDREVVLNTSSSMPEKEVEDYFKYSGDVLNKYYEGDKNIDLSIDFIGPSIDIGFRLAQNSTSRKFVLSVDIPYILSLTVPTECGTIPHLEIYYEGSKALKGVLGGFNYPIFWINTSSPNSIALLEDNLTGNKACGRDDIRKYCEAFYKEHAGTTFRPFIVSEKEQQLDRRPAWYDEKLQNMIKMFLEKPSDEIETADPVEADIDQVEHQDVDVDKIFDVLFVNEDEAP